MNILVYDIAAENGGAVSILECFYNKHKQDTKNNYFYILSTYSLEPADNITVVNVPEIKKGWAHRIVFDCFGVKKYIKKFQIDEVLSLQNTIIPCFKGRQSVYEHNALPFSEHRFSLRENKLMWLYQNVIGKFMIYSIRKADHVIVQTEWMKQAILREADTDESKIEVNFPNVSILEGHSYTRQKKCIFFYPANSASFKNHKLISEACSVLTQKGIHDYEVVFTLQGDESQELINIYNNGKIEGVDIKWIGRQPREKIFEWYSKSVLVFPSYIETVGLPIYEAMSVGCPLLLANCEYAKCVAKNYDDARYYNYDDKVSLANYMEEEIYKCRKLSNN